VDAQRVRQQLDRILTSAAFADAGRAGSFLRFVVERTLDGHTAGIKESVIAVEVLNRPASFDSKSDPIVRVEAGRLRARLTSYYEAEGEADTVLISLPKGGYVPEFIERRLPGAAKIPGVLRLSILPPEDLSFDSFAVSPDGRKLAFTAFLKGRDVLWVRALDSLEAKPLMGTDGATWPFWSPDSLTIAFFTPSKLKAIEINGGPPRDIADVIVGRGGAWSPEGIIVFCPRPVGNLSKVPATGGVPTPVTSLDQTRAEVLHAFPQFLPGGREFLYLAGCSRAGESSIRAGSLDSADSKVLLNADTSAAYAPALPGRPPSLLFVHDGALIAQAFDSRRLELSGEPNAIAPQVRFDRWYQAKFSVSGNGVLVYQGGSAENHQLALYDRQGNLLSAVGPPNDYLSFTLSPDERYAAANRMDDPGSAYPTVWVVDLSRGGAVFRFTDADAAQSEFTPVWSPDSREILLSRGDDRRMRLFRHALSGGAPECVLDAEGPRFPADWSGDGRFIAYNSQLPDYRNMHTWIMALEPEAAPHLFLNHSYEEFTAQFSPTGGTDAPRWIAYASRETGRYEVCVRDFPQGRHKWQVSNQGGLQPHWRRDGRELFYLSLDGTIMSVAVTPGPAFQFGPPEPLFTKEFRFMPRYAVWMNQYAVLRDGQRFLLNCAIRDAGQGAITAVIPW